ncbi:MAG: hypothetical protein ACFFDF_14105, partial [Candidatus Odinarchaeota archaeon]
MFISKTKKRIQALAILFLIMGTFTTMFNIYQFNFSLNDSFADEKINKKKNLFDIKFEDLKTGGYSATYSNTGENINITLHQSYLNNSFNTVLNTSNSNNNKFVLPCP